MQAWDEAIIAGLFLILAALLVAAAVVMGDWKV